MTKYRDFWSAYPFMFFQTNYRQMRIMCKIKPDNHTYELRGRIQADAINANAPVRKNNRCM